MKEIQLPPSWCSKICANSMMDVCVEDCAIERDCSRFKLKPDITIYDMPSYPIDEVIEMTKEEKFTSVVVYLSKITQHLKGEDDGKLRKDIYRAGTRRIP